MSGPLTAGAWTLGKHGDVPSAAAPLSRSDPHTVLFLGDLHLDNPHTARAPLKRVLDDAIERNAAIVLLGDQMDLMQGRNDRRSAKSALRAQYAGRDDYLTAALEDVTDFLLPYARHIWLVLDGNHEGAILRYNEVGMTRLLVHNLRAAGSGAIAPGYQTYAVLRLEKGDGSGFVAPFWLTHGSGGGAAVTGGVIGAQRRAVVYPDAEFVMSGHLHQEFYKPFVQHRISHRGRVYHTKQRHYQVSAWKQGFSNDVSWEAEKGLPPTIAGGWWLEVRRARGENAVPGYKFRFYEADGD
jgi:hypothetical protein